MYQFVNGNHPDILKGFFVRNRNRNVHQYNVRNADELNVPYALLDVSKKNFSRSLVQNIRNYLIDNIILR